MENLTKDPGDLPSDESRNLIIILMAAVTKLLQDSGKYEMLIPNAWFEEHDQETDNFNIVIGWVEEGGLIALVKGERPS